MAEKEIIIERTQEENETDEITTEETEQEKKKPGEPIIADDATPDTKLRDLIRKEDYQYNDIPEDMTVGELRAKMKAGTPYYEICPVDSVIREVHFIAIAAAHGIDYDEPYENWLKH